MVQFYMLQLDYYTQIVSKMGFTHGQLQIESETYCYIFVDQFLKKEIQQSQAILMLLDTYARHLCSKIYCY